MSKKYPPDINRGYIAEEFDISDYPDNYAEYHARSKGMKCDRCSEITEEFQMYYHLPTTFDFCEKSVWNIEMMTRR